VDGLVHGGTGIIRLLKTHATNVTTQDGCVNGILIKKHTNVVVGQVCLVNVLKKASEK